MKLERGHSKNRRSHEWWIGPVTFYVAWAGQWAQLTIEVGCWTGIQIGPFSVGFYL